MSNPETIAGLKSAMRACVLAVRSGLGADLRRRAAAAIASHGSRLGLLRDGVAVAGYAAIRGELDPAELLGVLSDRGHPVGLPVVTAPDAPLEFREWRPGAPMERGMFGVPAPGADAKTVLPEVIFVPLVAFDRDGYRLGLGAGYYDRTLAALRGWRDIAAVGVAFDEQRVEAVPHDANDQRLDWVLTPSGAFETCSERP